MRQNLARIENKQTFVHRTLCGAPIEIFPVVT